MNKHVSQREGFRLRRRVKELEAALDSLSRQFYLPEGAVPYWHKIATVRIQDRESGALVAARNLRYGISVRPFPNGDVEFFASKEPR